MPKPDAKEASKLPVKVELALPPLYRGNGSYTENPKGVRDVQFVMPGSLPKPDAARSLKLTVVAVEVLRVDSTAVPQPFVDPVIFKEWSSKS
ncbi:hypothetical protein ColTof4_06996 [Colletotrichum tofieldiae]|uniref:Uncharacterized protein n=1 Tax=Colletotrichum liriopes TaxID=708192 RepID=A0AA37GQI2_9PEZI|nr:hypothetical protein ColLi_07925 [Colletotrichum liriopes]GKT64601.1 hypothetical protein ColTof3_11940 [Colletotrichum tofieldiae]GKT74573.1 hypothetical protein ColTof4_06996 [Colletotrichum tofieldiae]GKT91756.1 hypothetical protein Ct61P_09606 [Colletotrichum tofieldiae]